MEILALEIEAEGVTPEQFQPYLKTEARCIWELYQSGILRDIYFRADQSEVVLMLECFDTKQAQQTLASLPLVKAGLITFDIIPLVPYPGFARLFEE